MIKLYTFLLLFFCLTGFVAKAQTPVVINKYAAVLNYQPCANSLLVDSVTGFNIGDTVLMIQMKGAKIDTTNTSNFGNVLTYNESGNYEYNVVKSVTGNYISLKYTIVRNYNYTTGKVQLVRVPSFQNYQVNQPHTCMPWNGGKGGVFALFVSNSLTLNDNINITGAGFIGGKNDQNPTVVGPTSCIPNNTDYFMVPDFDMGSMKGEGIAEVSLAKSYGRGKLANGGGGGNAVNAGGGGGSNAGIGGLGGSEYVSCNSNPANNDRGGAGGTQLGYSNTVNKIFLGGGGGSAQANNFTISNGGNGGGICIINAGTIIGNNKSIIANGQDGLQCINNGSFGSCHDGMAGGGGGGVILMNVNNFTSNTNLEVKGGKGADEVGWAGYYQVGPGGGAGGGCIWLKTPTIPAAAINSINGGANGVVTYNNSSWGAQPGALGEILTNLVSNFPTDTFNNPDIIPDFVYNRTNCFTYDFTNQSTITSGTISSYLWNFGDATTSSQQNPIHTYNDYGSYNISLTITRADGCQNTITKNVNIVYTPFLQISNDTSVCANVPLQLNASGGVSYSWSPSTGLDNDTLHNPTATISTSLTYVVTATDSFECIDIDSVHISMTASHSINATPETAKICGNGSIQLNVVGINEVQWSPFNTLSDPQSFNPIATPTETTVYIVSGKDDAGCLETDSVKIFVFQIPSVVATTDKDTISCTEPYAQLHATGALSYIWSPATTLNNPSSKDPIASLEKSTTFIVEGTDENGCKDIDSVFVDFSDNKIFFIPNTFSPNNDGVNDIFEPKYNCDLTLQSFSIYNRFGQRVFYTNNKYKGWDGTQNGNNADMGTYFWIIRGRDYYNRTIEKKGDVVLIR